MSAICHKAGGPRHWELYVTESPCAAGAVLGAFACFLGDLPGHQDRIRVLQIVHHAVDSYALRENPGAPRHDRKSIQALISLVFPGYRPGLLPLTSCREHRYLTKSATCCAAFVCNIDFPQ
jgi:hypothetical protein